MTWLEAFKVCFGHRAQVLALRRYVQGLLSDSARKSMEAMLARVTEPGSYQAFQHFITDAPWSADARLAAPARVDSGARRAADFRWHEFSQTRDALGRRGASVLRRSAARSPIARSPSPRRCGPGARLCARRRPLSAHGVGDRRGRGRARASPPRPVSRKMAPSADAVATGPGERVHRHRRAGRRGIWRQLACFAACCIDCICRMPSGISSHLTVFLGTPRLRSRAPGDAVGPRKHPPLATGATSRGRLADRGRAAPRWRRVRWRNRPEARRWTRGLRRDPRHPGRRLPPPSADARNLAPGRARRGATPRTKYYFVNLPPTASLTDLVRLAHHAGRSSNSIKTSRRARPRSFRRPHVSRLASPRRAHRDRVQLPPSRATARPSSHCTFPSVSRHRAGDLHGVFVCPATALPHPYRGAAVRSAPDLTK